MEDINKDIENLEEIINLINEELDKKDKNVSAILDLKDLLSLRNLIKAYKELEEENKNARNEIIKIIKTPEAIKNSINELKTNQFIGENVKLVILNYIDKITTDNEDLKNDLYQDGLSHKYLTLKATSIPTSVIQKKIEEVNNSNGYSPVNKIFIEKALNEILEEGRR